MLQGCIVTASLLLALSSNISTAEEDGKDTAQFATRKTEILKQIDERISKMQEHKTCVSSANDREAMKACHEKMKQYRMSEREEHMDEKMGRMEERKGRIEARKNKMKEKSESNE